MKVNLAGCGPKECHQPRSNHSGSIPHPLRMPPPELDLQPLHNPQAVAGAGIAFRIVTMLLM